jgi:hypothetical protein
MRPVIAFGLACALAAALPLFSRAEEPATVSLPFPGWPTQFEGKPLEPLPLTAQEREFERELPGRVARFRVQAEPGDLVVRWIGAATRKVHPARHCYRGSGFTITAMPAWVDAQGRAWSRFRAEDSEGKGHEVRELVVGPAESWPDVDGWYWAVARKAGGPWWAYTRATPLPGP